MVLKNPLFRNIRPTIASVCRECRKRYFNTKTQQFEIGDIVLIKSAKDSVTPYGSTKPLTADGEHQTNRGLLKHSDIIGRQVRDTVLTKKGVAYRLHEPTLSEYVCFTPRIVTPIYPQDTNLIVNLLDIHVSPPSSTTPPNDEPPLEILEAGTGHGSLTLQLSRAIHAANAARPPLPLPPPRGPKGVDSKDQLKESPEAEAHRASMTADYEEWKRTRRAIIHTLDNMPNHSNHARKVIRGFRNGFYSGNIDFHVGELDQFFSERQAPNSSDSTIPKPPQTPFLSHCILDLPSAHQKMDLVSQNLHPNGKLIIFVPSITQLADCVDMVKRLNLPLFMEQVLELGGGMSGGREWDVRAVKIRASEKRKKSEEAEKGLGEDGEREVEGVNGVEDAEGREKVEDVALDEKEKDKDWALVCRPKVGERIIGGGFLGVWSKMRKD
ncbi:hypothetical protein EJ08DRAFT_702921 [Tothia fuscella]|uniref:tRNA (adenine(58)-N(1))-methyltransferase catalytic subunit TRM61 n=1 Tax=Tothia fuscella TaxID=1048955 RepID=A0A9P4TTA2_9PEZI|nr:hypothetical protein EJ08DRAFT_702921 [Tothia fuscella]